ncbi:hypothetical protein NBRC116592_17270 [Colwellia sp. KU-HH00111]|uniref:hypothetical protein n=1 Tax=Colwellia sp. KU-HH00111 TaxID=3127652 RepID=UPI003109E9B4
MNKQFMRLFYLIILSLGNEVVAMQSNFTDSFIARHCRIIDKIDQQLGRQRILYCAGTQIRIGAREQLFIDLAQYDVTGIILERLHVSATYRHRPLLVIHGSPKTSLIKINDVSAESEGGMVFGDAFLCIDLAKSKAETRIVQLTNNQFHINNLEIINLNKGYLQRTKGCSM